MLGGVLLAAYAQLSDIPIHLEYKSTNGKPVLSSFRGADRGLIYVMVMSRVMKWVASELARKRRDLDYDVILVQNDK